MTTAPRSENVAGERPTRGQIFVIAAPSGTGKTTLCRRILEEDDRLKLSVSHTTRRRRTGERDGEHYHFVSPGEFNELVEQDGFLEHAEYNGNLYGTSWQAIEAPLESGDDVVLEIEVQGAEQVKERLTEATLIFLLPPTLQILAQRLRGRATDSEDVIQHRLALVDRELAAAPLFDYAVVNDDLDRAVTDVLEVMACIRSEQAARIADRFGLESALARWREAQPS